MRIFYGLLGLVFAGCALIFVSATNPAAAKVKLPKVEEGASRAAAQDILGNICPGIEPNYQMKLLLIATLKEKNPDAWAKGYESAAREMFSLMAKPEDRDTLCANALDLYGPQGSWVPGLLKDSK